MQNEGDIAAVARAAREAVKEYEAEIRSKADPRVELPRPTPSSSASEPAQLDTFVSDPVDDGNSSAWDQLRRSQEQSRASICCCHSDHSGPSADDSDQSSSQSRWDALRKANAAEPSSWERIRQDQARSEMATRARDADSDARDAGWQDSGAADRERRQREFDALLEKERAGADGGRWR